MNILMLSTFEQTGGAAVAAGRLMHALQTFGHEVSLLVRDASTEKPFVETVNTSFWKRKINFIRFAVERGIIFILNQFSKQHLFAVSLGNTGNDIHNHPLVKKADIIHIHWINQGFLSLNDIRKLQKAGKKIVWTMHDMWCFTGICHYAGTCTKYKTGCEACPLLKNHSFDITKQLYHKKQIQFVDILFVGVSQWISRVAQESLILKQAQVCNIPNPIDTALYTPMDKELARKKFGLPFSKKLVLFAAAKLNDERKGLIYCSQACSHLDPETIELVYFGGLTDNELLKSIPLKSHQLGYLKTPADIAMAYSACDVFVTPSLEDNLPNTIMEAMSCGTPCVGFEVGGIPEMIDHLTNGYLSTYKSSEDLAAGINWCLDHQADLSCAAREKAERCYAENVVSNQYLEVYNRLLHK